MSNQNPSWTSNPNVQAYVHGLDMRLEEPTASMTTQTQTLPMQHFMEQPSLPTGLGINNFNATQDHFEVPLFSITASAPLVTSHGRSLINQGNFNSFHETYNMPVFPPTHQAPFAPNVSAFSFGQSATVRPSIVGPQPFAQGANNNYVPNVLNPYDSPAGLNTSGMPNRPVYTLATQNVPGPSNFHYSSLENYLARPYSTMLPPTPSVTPQQTGLFPNEQIAPQHDRGFGGNGFMAPYQNSRTQEDLEEQRLHQQRNRMMQNMQRQQRQQTNLSNLGLGPPPAPPQVALPRSQPSGFQQPHYQSTVHLPSTSLQCQGSLDFHPHTYSPHAPPISPAEVAINVISHAKRKAEDPQLDAPPKRVQNGNPRAGHVQRSTGSPQQRTNVPAVTGRSELPSTRNNLHGGRQQALPRLVPGPVKPTNTVQQQQQPLSLSETTDDMPPKRIDSGYDELQATNKTLGIRTTQHESQTASSNIASPASQPSVRDVQHVPSPARVPTSGSLKPAVQHRPTPVPTSHGGPSPQPVAQTPISSLEPQHPPVTPQTDSHQAKPRLPPPDVFAAVLKAATDDTKGVATGAAQRERSQIPATPSQLLLAGPLTREQNIKALVESVKDDMRRCGPAVGTNPDLDMPAAPHSILMRRMKWTEEYMREQGAASGPSIYVAAHTVMESAVGYRKNL